MRLLSFYSDYSLDVLPSYLINYRFTFCDYSFPTVFLNNYSRVLMVVRSYVLLASITFESHSTTGSTYIFPFLLYGFDYGCCPAPFACCCALPLYLTLRHFSGFSSFFFHLVCCGLNVFWGHVLTCIRFHGLLFGVLLFGSSRVDSTIVPNVAISLSGFHAVIFKFSVCWSVLFKGF